MLCNLFRFIKGGNNIKIFNFVNSKKKEKVILSLNKKQIDLLIKSVYIAQCNIKREDPDLNLLFEDKEHSYDLMYILQRLIGATANKQLYNINDSCFFIKDREQFYINNEKTIDKKKVI